MSFSPAAAPVRSISRPNPNTPPKTLLSLPDCSKGHMTCANAFSWRSTASYVRLQVGVERFSRMPIVVKHLLGKKTGVLKCATIEEIEAEKFFIEKDVKERMEKTIETIRSNFNSIRTGRANPAMLDLVEELLKVVAKQVEEGKVALRNIRRDAIKAYEKLEKEKKLSEDNVKDLSGDLQKVTDEYMKKIDTIYKQKEKELLKV